MEMVMVLVMDIGNGDDNGDTNGTGDGDGVGDGNDFCHGFSWYGCKLLLVYICTNASLVCSLYNFSVLKNLVRGCFRL